MADQIVSGAVSILAGPRELVAAPLSAAAFAPFGAVLAACGEGVMVNQGRAMRHLSRHSLPQPSSAAARLSLSVYRVSPSLSPLKVTVLERHPHSAQLFAPMAAISYPVVVAPASGDAPDLAAMCAFMAEPGQAVLYAAGIWHFPLAMLGAGADFTMLIWETGGEDDTEMFTLPEPRTIRL